ncbi:U2 small nuclear ribonucleoprotein A' [Holothuria leucospilota]|uniref:U2 small nuclear ribonucleoprotein A n=1 Tax=Holothuria leucospilota TaxID=206669 RepID=A0A9Q1CA45_HOLLE|nr:U2 small nuclear ribonucleoprotein A' [Holothuria leucospilota]
MVKLSPELIEQCAQYINAVRDRELDLRGYKIPVIENLGATLDQFDTIDFSDNEIRKLDGFPLLKRLKCLLLNNNRICRIGENLEQNLPKLESIVLTNNLIQELGDIDPLASISTLTSLSLLRNPVVSKKHYRQYVIHKIPQIKLLDFRKVRQKEREASAQLFKGKKGQQLAKDLGKKSRTFVPGAEIPGEKPTTSGPTAEDIAAIKKAITEAKSLEEVERLNQILRSGRIPGKEAEEKGAGAKPAVEEEEEKEEEPGTEEMDGVEETS